MNKKSILDLNLIDNFLMTESMLHKETAEPVARIIIERATGLKVKNLVIECEKTVNGVDTDLHGIRLDVAINEINIKEEHAEKVRVFDIEPNNKMEVHLPRRNRYYQSMEDVKLLDAGVDYEKLPELWSIWILPYDPFGKNQMLYVVKNIVEGFEEINYNDGIRTLYLYTDGEYGGTQSLKNLLTYLKHSSLENAVDSELAALHPKVEQLKRNREIGVKYMHVREMMEDALNTAREQGLEQGRAQGLEQGRAQGLEQGRAQGLEQGRAQGLEQGRAQGLEQGRAQGLEQGIRMIIETCQDLNMTEKETLLKLETSFSITADTAKDYMKKYWKFQA